jgi:hypothetical protein
MTATNVRSYCEAGYGHIVDIAHSTLPDGTPEVERGDQRPRYRGLAAVKR